MCVLWLTCSSCFQILILKKNGLILLISIVKQGILGVILLKFLMGYFPFPSKTKQQYLLWKMSPSSIFSVNLLRQKLPFLQRNEILVKWV